MKKLTKVDRIESLIDALEIDENIIKEHIIGGSVVEEFVIPKEMWADAISPEQMRKMAGVS